MQKSLHSRLLKFYLPLTAVVLLIAATVLEVTGVTHVFHDKASDKPVTASQYTKGEPTSSNQSTSADNDTKTPVNTTQPGDDKSMSGGSDSTTLVAPSGDFVSNHHPNLDSNPAPNTIASVCITSPGATCNISFTNNGVTKSLQSQTADRGGAAYWSWSLQDLGLTAGSWHIDATATLNGKTLKSSDAQMLEVGL